MGASVLYGNASLRSSIEFRYFLRTRTPGAPLTYFNEGGGGGPSDFFGSEILAKSDFFGSMKDAGTFLVRKKEQRDFLGCKKRTKGFFGVCKQKQ